ncbi:MAG: substrate-binding domain-containing protein [Blautia sp.]
MDRKHRIVLGLGIYMAASLFAGCGRSEEVSTDAAGTKTQEQEMKEGGQEDLPEAPIEIDTSRPVEKGARIAVVTKSTEGEFWNSIKNGMEDAVKYLNQAYGLKGEEKITMTFEGPDDAKELTDMINTVDAVLSENPSVLCLAAGDEDAGQAQLETARDNGIPVILFDSMLAVDEDLYTAYCGTNDRKLGEEAAEKLAASMGGKGKVALISHWKNDMTSIERVEGFKDYLAREAPDMKLAGELTMEEDEDLEQKIQNLLKKTPDLAGLFCTNIDVAETALDALDAIEVEGLKVVGVDGSSRQIKAIEEGREVGVVSQNPYLMGFQTIYTASLAAADEKEVTDKRIYTDYAWLDAKNLEDPSNQPYFYK